MFRRAKFHNQWPLWYKFELAFHLSFLWSPCQWFCTRHKGSWCRQSLWAYIEEKDCQSCIANATNEIRSLCPNSKGAIKWSQNCTLKYHNVDFFGHIDHETWFFTKDPQNLTDYQSIRQKKSEWLTQLAGQASINPPMVLFGQLDIGESNKLNGSVQCTRDLLSLDCMKCLSYSIGFLPKCCDSRKAVRLFSGTCELRFEAYYNKA